MKQRITTANTLRPEKRAAIATGTFLFLKKNQLTQFTLTAFLAVLLLASTSLQAEGEQKEAKAAEAKAEEKKADQAEGDKKDTKGKGEQKDAAEKADNTQAEGEGKKEEPQKAPPAPEPVKLVPKQVDFRIGKIIAAELTKAKVPIKNLSKFDLPKSMEPKKKQSDEDTSLDIERNYAFAVVAVKLNKDRTISIYDYVLSDGNENFKCYAVSKNDEPFDVKKWEIKDAKQWETIKLLYEVEVPAVDAPKIQYSFINRILKDKEDKIIIPFKNIGSDNFTPYKKIPQGGMLEFDSPKVRKAAPAPAKAAEKAEEKKKDIPADFGPDQAK